MRSSKYSAARGKIQSERDDVRTESRATSRGGRGYGGRANESDRETGEACAEGARGCWALSARRGERRIERPRRVALAAVVTPSKASDNEGSI